MNQLILKGAEVSKIPSPEQMALPGEGAATEPELEKFISLAMNEKTSKSSAVFQRVKKEIGRNFFNHLSNTLAE